MKNLALTCVHPFVFITKKKITNKNNWKNIRLSFNIFGLSFKDDFF